MKSRLLQVMAIAGLILPLTVYADGNTVVVEQEGIGNVATIIQQDATNSHAGIYQIGDQHQASINQAGMTDAYDEIRQSGIGNELRIEMEIQNLSAEQVGEGNVGHLMGEAENVSFRQEGNNNSAYINVRGFGYPADLAITQMGNENLISLGCPEPYDICIDDPLISQSLADDLFYTQIGDSNEIHARLDLSNYQEITQLGDDNYFYTRVTDGYMNILLVNQVGTGNQADSYIGWGENQQLILTQDGLGNAASTWQHADRNQLEVLQQGNLNLADIVQRQDNTGMVEQTGDNNQADLRMWMGESLVLLQDGANHYAEYDSDPNSGPTNSAADISQSGNSHSAIVYDFGNSDSTLLLLQDGTGHNMLVNQSARHSDMAAQQDGSGNEFSVIQSGIQMSADIMQSGNFNVVHLTQEGVGNTVDITQQ
ncbi:hypothetical protein DJ030_07350 [bacterium endosymbiont of Escarpia laminata]|nr:MAG: hypothetical protein DJ030_07350 [bacterium endosymbiont of Escarpia laminata]